MSLPPLLCSAAPLPRRSTGVARPPASRPLLAREGGRAPATRLARDAPLEDLVLDLHPSRQPGAVHVARHGEIVLSPVDLEPGLDVLDGVDLRRAILERRESIADCVVGLHEKGQLARILRRGTNKSASREAGGRRTSASKPAREPGAPWIAKEKGVVGGGGERTGGDGERRGERSAG